MYYKKEKILKNKTIDYTLMYVPNDEKQIYYLKIQIIGSEVWTLLVWNEPIKSLSELSIKIMWDKPLGTYVPV